MTISQIRLLSVPVADPDRAKSFYTEVLGFEVLADNRMSPTQRWVQVAPKGADTSITLVTWFDSMPAGSLRGLVLETDDLDADVAALTARGVSIPDGIQDQPWGRFVTFTDPDGNGLVLQATASGF
jgi:predicted enzyme related to lactoylglutathione lyase